MKIKKTSETTPIAAQVVNTYSESTQDTYCCDYINTNLVNLIYPIGSIYMSVNSTNPSVLFGGTWVAWGTGRVPVGIDTSQTEFETVEQTGGSKYLQAHRHNIAIPWSESGSVGQGYPIQQATHNYYKYIGGNGIMENEGTGDSGNLQPYITCYMWKRTE